MPEPYPGLDKGARFLGVRLPRCRQGEPVYTWHEFFAPFCPGVCRFSREKRGIAHVFFGTGKAYRFSGRRRAFRTTRMRVSSRMSLTIKVGGVPPETQCGPRGIPKAPTAEARTPENRYSIQNVVPSHVHTDPVHNPRVCGVLGCRDGILAVCFSLNTRTLVQSMAQEFTERRFLGGPH